MCLVSQKTELLDRQRKLEARISNYEHRMSVIMKLDDDTQWLEEIPDIDPQSAEASDNMLELHPDEWFTLERERITPPSSLAPGEIECLSLNSIAMIEAELRKAQVTDALEGLRLALGEKSLCFRTEVRNARAKGRPIKHGTMFISLTVKLEGVEPHICMPAVPYSVYPSILSIRTHFITLLTMI
jgi:hypothetical protein